MYKVKKAIVMFSGGKDSAFALLVTLLQGFEIPAIVTFIPLSNYPWYVHRPFIEFTDLQLQLLSMSNRHVKIPLTSSERELEKLEIKRSIENLYEKIPFDYIVIGIVASDAQRTLFLDICDAIGVKLYAPFWGKDPAQHLLDVVKTGIEFILTSVNAWGLPVEFLGQVVDLNLALKIIELSKRHGFNPSFEGGEAETFVIYTPLFREKRICVEHKTHVTSYFEGYAVPKKVYIC